MSTGTLTATTLALSDRVLLTASGPNTLDLEGNAGADVNLIGIDTLTFLGELNTGTSALGGHVLSFRGERATAMSPPGAFSVPIGVTDVNLGLVMPQSGTVIALTLSSSAAATCTIEVIGSVSGTLLSLSIVAATFGSATGTTAFVANEKINCQVTAGTTGAITRVFWVVRLD